jgi:hypothetical protein
MSFVTQGKIKVSIGTDTRVKVSSTNEYRVTHRKKTYTVFIDDDVPDARCFKEDHPFEVNVTILPYLVELAGKDILLELTIDPSSSKLTQIQIPA